MMNSKGFTLIELLGCLLILALIMTVGLYSARGTLATTLTILTDVSEKEIKTAAETYVLEYGVTWINNGEEYTCLTVDEFVDAGYFDADEVISYKDKKIKVLREMGTKVISSVGIVDVCE